MPKISISCSTAVKDIETTRFLHQHLGWALSSAARMLSLGEKGVFYTCQLYLSDHLEHERKIRSIISFFQSRNTPLTLLEIGDDEDWGSVTFDNLLELKITEEQMLNELNNPE